MVSLLLRKFLTLFFILKSCRCDENLGWGENITKLYELVSSAVKADVNSSQPTRRLLVNNSAYHVHLKKLKNVNGLKFHNILIKRSGPEMNSTIYINNPLESKLPHPFMSLAEFKNVLAEQVNKDREAFMRAKKKEEYSRKWAAIKATAKLKTKSTSPKQTYKEANTATIMTKINLNAIINKTIPKHNVKTNLKLNTNNILTKTTTKSQTTRQVTKMTLKTNNKTSASNMTVMNLLVKEKEEYSGKRAEMKAAAKTQTKPISPKQTDKETNSTIVTKTNLNTIINETIPKYNVKINFRSDTTNTITKTTRNSQTTRHDAKMTLKTNKISARNMTVMNSRVKLLSIDKTSVSNHNPSRNTSHSNITGPKSLLTDNITHNSIPDNTTTKSNSIDKNISSINKSEEQISTTMKEITIEERLVAVNESGDTDEELSSIVKQTTTDEELWTDEKEDTNNDDETEEPSPEDETTETSTTTKSLPTTTRVKWSKPRVYLGDKPEDATTSL